MDSTYQHSHWYPVCSFTQFVNHLRNLWVRSPCTIEQKINQLRDDTRMAWKLWNGTIQSNLNMSKIYSNADW